MLNLFFCLFGSGTLVPPFFGTGTLVPALFYLMGQLRAKPCKASVEKSPISKVPFPNFPKSHFQTYDIIYQNFGDNMYKKLPHLCLENHYQFITFRTYDSLDFYARTILEKDITIHKKEQELDIYLDNSKSGAYLYGEAIELLKDIIFEKNHIMYEIIIFAIMPNHVHLLIKQLDKIANIVKHIKGKSSFVLNKHLKKSGRFWHINYFDKAIREEKHFAKVYQYIENNPIKAELKDNRVFYG